MNHAKITGIGFHVPERVVTNQDLEKMMVFEIKKKRFW